MSEQRQAVVDRKTRETTIHIELSIDGSGVVVSETGIPFLDHMLDALGRHGLFDIVARASGDLIVEAHHTIEDVGISLGRAFNEALGDGRGITRMAHAYAPLDEALALVVVDRGGRGYAVIDTPLTGEVGGVDADMFRHFLESFAIEARMNVHARVVAGVNTHHKVEALFKALARALDAATRRDPRLGDAVPSTKGALDRG
ncbi:MAG: imidazoleglycerol-phosphate dehydratase HisB [Chloroflexota bacterium]|nr:MAG: imidazoleglycerol-phosphate dehydratase HisB [Chloroflexota bacterium]